MIACICMGSIELALGLLTFGAAALSVSATHFYNVWRCKVHNCKHKCGKK